jgi:choline-sulfatase
MLSLFLACTSVEPGPDPTAEVARPNVVVFVLDTLRADSFSTDVMRLPYARAVQGGTRFTSAQSTGGWTIPSVASMLTGLYPSHHGVTMGKVPSRSEEEPLALPRLPDQPVLAERFQAAGYTTFGTTSNALITAEQGFDRGFDHYRPFTMKEGHWHGDGKLVDKDGWRVEDRGKAPADAIVVLDQVGEWRDEMEASESWFLWVHLMDSHMPYFTREPWYSELGGGGEDDDLDRWSAYRSSFAWQSVLVDALLGTFPEDTIVVFISDHGEHMGEGGLYGHNSGLRAPLMDVPFVISGPGIQARRVDQPVSQVDLAPTLAELCDLEHQAADGVSLVPWLHGGSVPARPVYGHRGPMRNLQRDTWSVVEWPWRLVQKGATRELQDLRSDDIVTNAAVEARLSARLDAHIASTVEPVRVEDEDEGDIDGLRALGYLD